MMPSAELAGKSGAMVFRQVPKPHAVAAAPHPEFTLYGLSPVFEVRPPGKLGFVDKYIGDAIVAAFGAPLDDPNHAQSAINAALRCRDRLHKLNTDINSGDALVGNVGSRQRFNYTGDGRHRECGVAA